MHTCSLYAQVLLVQWYQPLYLSVPIYYSFRTGTAVYMHWYCRYCWYIGTSHYMSRHQCVTGTALILLFICTGTVGPIGTLVPATLCLCTNMLLVLHWYCSLYVLVLWILLVHWYQPLHIGTSHSMSMCLYVTGTTLVLLFICTGTVGTVGTLVPASLFLCTNMLLAQHWYCSLYVMVLCLLLVHWYQFLCSSVNICYWYHTSIAFYMYWYCRHSWKN